MATIPTKPSYNHGSQGTQPPSAFDYESGDPLDADHLDYYLDTLFDSVDSIIDTLSELDTELTNHAADVDAHHAKYTDAEAVTAVDGSDIDILGDADTVDGEHASAFADAVHTHTQSDITDFASAAGEIYVQNTEPSSPSANDIWIDTST